MLQFLRGWVLVGRCHSHKKFMKTSKHSLGLVLIICWALLLSARCLSAGINSARPMGSYEASLEYIGWLMPTSAWISLVAGLVLCWRSDTSCKIAKDGDTK
jgi:hypothetical protein